MNPKLILQSNRLFLRLILTPIVALSLVAASIATVSADPQPPKHKKKYVLVVGSNIPVPVKEAAGPQPKTSVPIRTYSEDEFRKIPGATTPAQVLANDPSITITGRH